MNPLIKLVAFVALLMAPLAAPAQVCSVAETRIPADIPVPNAEATASTFQQFSWDSFLGLNAAAVGGSPANVPLEQPLWRAWSSTVDLLSCQGSPTPSGCACAGGDCSQSGARYFPAACRGVPGYQQYRVLQQRGRFDNAFLQADVAGLTNSPVLDRFGNFLRYEILVNPVTYANVVEEGLWDQSVLDANSNDLVFRCSDPGYSGGDPANPGMGNMVLKVAWLDAEGEAGAALNLDHYYTEDLLVYTPGYSRSDGVESCELRTMAMVGMHIAHKTLRQPNWIWSTFEHRDVAPNCTEEMTNPGNTDTNMSCPVSVEDEFTLNGTRCNEADPACAPCNVTPASNDLANLCRNPTTQGLEGWCLDQQPAAAQGISKLCRHIPITVPSLDAPAPIPNPLPENYSEAAAWNQACVNELQLGGHTPWSHYMLISGQWLASGALPPEPEPPATLECDTVADEVFFGIVNADAIEPKVQTRGGAMRPFLGNITMESYGKSNCIGCHSRSVIDTSGGASYTGDFMYFPTIQVFGQDGNFLTWMADEPGASCQAPEDPAILEFDLTLSAVNSFVAEQAIELQLGLEIPSSLPAPTLTLRDGANPAQPWSPVGEDIELAVDDSCESGSCPVDLIYPSANGRSWRQYRSVPDIDYGPGSGTLAARVIVEFEGLRCDDIDPLDFRLWVSDNTQNVYANQVDSDYLAGTLFLLPQPPPPEGYLPTIPTLSRLGLLLLILGVAVIALRQGGRF